jgi:AICAR transformylase/IMP cyclohydrolase PurH
MPIRSARTETFCALSRVVGMETAKFLKQQVSDRIVAPGFTPEALALLQKKKQGGYISSYKPIQVIHLEQTNIEKFMV